MDIQVLSYKKRSCSPIYNEELWPTLYFCAATVRAPTYNCWRCPLCRERAKGLFVQQTHFDWPYLAGYPEHQVTCSNTIPYITITLFRMELEIWKLWKNLQNFHSEPIPTYSKPTFGQDLAQHGSVHSLQLHSHPHRSGLGQLALARRGADGRIFVLTIFWCFFEGLQSWRWKQLGKLNISWLEVMDPLDLSRCISYATWGYSSYGMLVY